MTLKEEIQAIDASAQRIRRARKEMERELRELDALNANCTLAKESTRLCPDGCAACRWFAGVKAKKNDLQADRIA